MPRWGSTGAEAVKIWTLWRRAADAPAADQPGYAAIEWFLISRGRRRPASITGFHGRDPPDENLPLPAIEYVGESEAVRTGEAGPFVVPDHFLRGTLTETAWTASGSAGSAGSAALVVSLRRRRGSTFRWGARAESLRLWKACPACRVMPGQEIAFRVVAWTTAEAGGDPDRSPLGVSRRHDETSCDCQCG